MDYLKELFNVDFKEFLVSFEYLNGWNIGFTHFIRVNHTPSSETLECAFQRHAAIICPRNHKSSDLILPAFNGEDLVAVIIQVG